MRRMRVMMAWLMAVVLAGWFVIGTPKGSLDEVKIAGPFADPASCDKAAQRMRDAGYDYNAIRCKYFF
jgi:hypothetical protein